MGAQTNVLGLAIFLAVTHLARAGILVGSSPDGVLYDVDPLTGLATNPRDIMPGGPTGLAFGTDGTLYGIRGNPGETQHVFTIDLATGAFSVLSEISMTSEDFGFDPISSQLVGISGIDSDLFFIDPSTGVLTEGPHVSDHPWGTLAVNSLGEAHVLYRSPPDHDLLYRIDLGTGGILQEWVIDTDLGILGTTFISPTELLIADGDLYGTDMLYSYDLNSKVLSTIGPTGLDNGLVTLAYIPEPSTALLLVSGAIIVLSRRSYGAPTTHSTL